MSETGGQKRRYTPCGPCPRQPRAPFLPSKFQIHRSPIFLLPDQLQVMAFENASGTGTPDARSILRYPSDHSITRKDKDELWRTCFFEGQIFSGAQTTGLEYRGH